MDHDGKITSKDSAMFHERMEDDEVHSHASPSSYSNGGWTPLHTIVQWGMILAFVGFILLVLKGILPLNFVTFIMGVGCLGGIVGLLTM